MSTLSRTQIRRHPNPHGQQNPRILCHLVRVLEHLLDSWYPGSQGKHKERVHAKLRSCWLNHPSYNKIFPQIGEDYKKTHLFLNNRPDNTSNTNQEYPQTNIAILQVTPVQQNPLPFLCCPNITIHVLKTNKLHTKKSWSYSYSFNKNKNIQTTGQSVKFLENFGSPWILMDPIPGLRSIRPNVQNATTC